MNIEPCFLCGSRKRAKDRFWSPACPKHEGVHHIVHTSVSDAASTIHHADKDELSMALQFENAQRVPRRTLLDAIRREIKKRTKGAK